MSLTISVITPSFNQAPFLPECLESILNQTYPAIEHLVYDPGSPDGSQDVVRRYPHATLIDEPDKGQSDAVSKGFLAAKGDIIGWLNSDDCYASNDVFATVIERFLQPDAPDIVYGRGAYIDDYSKHLRDAYVNESPETLPWRLHKEVGILQPTLFLRRSVIEQIGVLSEDLNFGMDYEYWIRATKAGLKFAFLPKNLAYGRYYEDNKTLGKRGESLRELCDIVKQQFGYASVEWIRRYAEFKVENFDSILADSSNRTVTNPEKLEQETKSLLEAYNTSHDTLKFLLDNRGKRPFNTTVKAMEDLGIPLEHPFQEIPLDQETAPYHYCHTVTGRRWAFKRDWKNVQLQKTRAAFAELRSQRKNDTCVIVGNGPSLKKIDFSLLNDQDVFITNYAFLNEELLGYAKYLGVVNYLVAEQGAHQFNLLKGVIKLFPYWLGYCINGGDDTFFFPSIGKPEFSKDIFENVSWRSTVSFFQMQIAYSLGYRRVLMIGFDHNYSQDVSAKEGDILLCDKDDENHFDPRYFKGKRWQAADVDNMEAMYVLAKQAFEEDNREIVNCTIGGKLELFKRGRLEDYVGKTAIQQESNQRLGSLKNIHQGKRCVIVGNDVSLHQIDLSFLRQEICLATDLQATQLSKQYSLEFNYWAITQISLERDHLEQLNDFPGIKFVNQDSLDHLPPQNDLVYVNIDQESDFSDDPNMGLQKSESDWYVAVQLAYYMGFQEVVLLGVSPKNLNPDVKRRLESAMIQFGRQNRQLLEAQISTSTSSLLPQQDYREVFLSHTKENSKSIYLDEISVPVIDKTFIGITIFTIPEAFHGIQGITQRNAILSWKSLSSNIEIVLFGESKGTAEIARELSLTHIPQIEQLGQEMLVKIKEIAQYPVLAYLQPTTLLTPVASAAIQTAFNRLDKFMIIGRCWEIDLEHSIDFSATVWQKQLHQLVEETGCLTSSNAEAYFIFSHQLVDTIATLNENQNLILAQTQHQDCPLIDGSQIKIAVKQSCEFRQSSLTQSNIVENSSYQLKPLATKYAPKLSIVITAHNQSTKINRAIESILVQPINDYEIIIVDDGSTDDIRQTIAPYQSCLKYIHQEHQGILVARNRGIWSAKGELLIFLEAQDYLAPQSLQAQIECLDNDPSLDLLGSGRRLLSRTEATDSEPWHDLPNLEEDIHIWKLWQLWKPLNNCIIMFRRDRLQAGNGFNLNLDQEVAIVDLMLRLTTFQGCQAKWLHQSTCISNQEKPNQMEDSNRLARNFELVLNNFFNYPHLKHWIEELEPIARFNALVWLGWLGNITNQNHNRNKYLQRSLQYLSGSESEILEYWVKRFSKFSQDFAADSAVIDLEDFKSLLR